MTPNNRAQLAEAIKQSAKSKAAYERTGEDEYLTAFLKWDRERARLLRQLQDESHAKAQAGVR